MAEQTNNLFLVRESKFENNKPTDVQEFDKWGNLTQHKNRILLENNRKKYRNDETFDNSGKLIRLRFYDNETLQHTTVEYRYEYDDRGNLFKKKCYVKNRPYEEIVYFYDENNYNIRVEFYDKEDEKLSSIAYYEYDKHGNCITLVARKGTGKLNCKISYCYCNGKKVEEKNFGGNGHLLYTTLYEYDNQDCVEEKSYKRGVLIRKLVMQYDKNNFKINVQVYSHIDIGKWKVPYLHNLAPVGAVK